VTHLLTGAVLARAGVNRRAAYVTVAMTIAAEFPDIDTAWGFAGPLKGFQHHRGITHTLVGVPVEAALITGAFWLWHSLRKPAKTRAAPVHWGWMYAGTLLALLSHLLLDWTNNYGIRPFFPFDPRWYAGGFVFIVEPVMLLLLGGALLLPGLFGLINSEVGARRTRFPARGWSIVALSGIGLLYALRLHERQTAEESVSEAAPGALRVFASPHPIDPFRWSVVSEFSDRYQLSTLTTLSGVPAPPSPADTLFKPVNSPAIETAKRSELGRIYLDWAVLPVVTESPDTSDPRHPLVLVTFADARFMYATVLGDGRENPPISGSVLLDMAAPEGQRVVETRMDGKMQR
jgi:inner membrane protein